MTVSITGKSIEVGPALREHVARRIGEAVDKYFGRGSQTQIVLKPDGPGIRAECSIHLDSGPVLRTEGQAGDARLAFDIAADRIEKRLRRYKRRLRENHGSRDSGIAATAYVIQAPDAEEELPADDNPVIIAEEATALRSLTVGEAVMEMDLGDLPALVFRHAGHGGINVVYRRPDGNIGWVDPSTPGRPKGNAGG